MADREIDKLRTQGEHDHLDYKRMYKLDSPSDKAEFTKDVLSLANTGGPVSKLLVGVEDNGSFTIPLDAAEHARLLRKLVDTTLQAIVSERTGVASSILVQHGEHREGPYVLITITSKTADLPYRFFIRPADAKLPGASQSGEVWVRHGTSKRLATADEVAALEERAILYRSLFP
ncbi:MAG: AlbA family DNA-binding domain-containing protein [Thermomicrobiales bacterium]